MNANLHAPPLTRLIVEQVKSELAMTINIIVKYTKKKDSVFGVVGVSGDEWAWAKGHGHSLWEITRKCRFSLYPKIPLVNQYRAGAVSGWVTDSSRVVSYGLGWPGLNFCFSTSIRDRFIQSHIAKHHICVLTTWIILRNCTDECTCNLFRYQGRHIANSVCLFVTKWY